MFVKYGPYALACYAMNMKISAVQGDITVLSVDAIVNAANPELRGGAGVCGAIFAGAGYDAMTKACQAIGGCKYGEAVITDGFELPARYVIHAVGPIYGQHNGREAEILTSAYIQSLRVAEEYELTSIAFPLISTGVYGYPKNEAIRIAVVAIREHFMKTPVTSLKKIIICAFEPDDEAALHAAFV